MTVSSTASPSLPTPGLNLWERVQVTDPAYTRGFQTATGFSGTSISPIYLVRKATDAFGPIGLGWGIELIEERFIEGAPIAYNADGSVAVRTVVHSARFELWYVLNGQRGSIKHWGSTTVVGRRGESIFTNEDAQKMTQTDAMSKCLSMLGFGADVHLGLFDDAKYVAGIEAAIASGQLAGVNLKVTAAPEMVTSGQVTTAPEVVTCGSQPARLSPRYQAYRERIARGAVADRAAARQVIQSDAGLSETERALLLSLPDLQIQPAEAAEGEVSHA